MSLEGLTALVTGSGAGVGRGIAVALAAAGAHVVAATRSANGQSVVDEIGSRGHRATWAHCDVTDPAAVSAAFWAATRAGPKAASMPGATEMAKATALGVTMISLSPP